MIPSDKTGGLGCTHTNYTSNTGVAYRSVDPPIIITIPFLTYCFPL